MNGQPTIDLKAIRQRWAGREWHYGEDQDKGAVVNAFLVTAGGRAISLRHPTELERNVLSRAASAPGDVQALLRALGQAQGRADILAAQIIGWSAQCVAQVEVLQDVLSHLCGARYNVDTLKRRIEEVTETDAGAVLLAGLKRTEANFSYAISALASVDAERLAALERAEQAKQDYVVVRDAIIAQLDPPDDDQAEPAILVEAVETAAADATAFRAACLHARRALDLTHDEDRLREHLDQVLAGEHPGAELALQIDQLHAQIEGLNLAATQYSESRDSWYKAAKVAERRYTALSRAAEIVVEQWIKAEEPTPLDTGVSALAVVAREGEAELSAELEAARDVVTTARSVLDGCLSSAALYSVLLAYDEAVKASE